MTLLTVRDATGIASYVITPVGISADHVVSTLASAVGASAAPVEGVPGIADVAEIGWLEERSTGSVSRDTQSGGDQTEIAILLSRIMRPGTWVAMTLRAPKRSEVRHVRRWFAHRLHDPQTHYSNDGDAVVASVFAGASSHEEVAGLLAQLAAVIPGFDVDTTVPKHHSSLSLRVVALVAIVALVATGIGSHRWLYGLIAAAVICVVGQLSRVIPTRARRTYDALFAGLDTQHFPPPPSRTLPPSAPSRKTQTVQTGTSQSGTTSQTKVVERPGSYPLARSAFLFAPSMLVGVISPHVGTAAGLANLADRPAPEALLGDIGPVVGYAKSSVGEQSVHLDAAELYSGVVMFGIPGSGKTVAVQNLWAWHSLAKARPQNRPEYPSRQSTLIAFESKGEGATAYERWAQTLGGNPILVEVGDSNSPAIDIGDPSAPPLDRAQFIVSAMIYAFGQDAIGDRSAEVLSMVIPAALLCPPEIAKSTAEITIGPVSFMTIAHILLCGRGDEAGVALDAELSNYQAKMNDFDPYKRELGLALQSLEPLYGPKVTPAQRRTLSESSRNKINLLISVPHWWDPNRPRGTWGDILNNHASVIFNAGITRSGSLVDERLTDVLAGMSAFSLRDAIQRNCSGWLASNKSVTIFSDELALLVKSSAEVIEWCRDAGRSYGVRLVLATQRPEQLATNVRSALRGFGTTLWFQQSDPAIVAEAVSQLSLGGEEWTNSDIGNLAEYHAILRATAAGRVQPPVPIRMAYWTSPQEFIEAQGWGNG
ncbi:MAG: type IV secretory system conjugative DNA transfer family protein [Acidimicrobiales bacterium]